MTFRREVSRYGARTLTAKVVSTPSLLRLNWDKKTPALLMRQFMCGTNPRTCLNRYSILQTVASFSGLQNQTKFFQSFSFKSYEYLPGDISDVCYRGEVPQDCMHLHAVVQKFRKAGIHYSNKICRKFANICKIIVDIYRQLFLQKCLQIWQLLEHFILTFRCICKPALTCTEAALTASAAFTRRSGSLPCSTRTSTQPPS